MLKIGDAVKFFRYETADGKSDYVSYNAIVLGVRPGMQASRMLAGDGLKMPMGGSPPVINLVCLNPGDLMHLNGAEWQLCMTRHFDILPENSAGAAVDFYREVPETFATAHTASGDGKYDFPEIDEANLPSDADLDSTVKEEDVKAATSTKKNSKPAAWGNSGKKP